MEHFIRRLSFLIRCYDDFKRYHKMRLEVNEKGYTYKDFDDYRCIFVHIPKCAGVSVCKSLFGNLAGGHTTLREYKLIFGSKDFENYYKFTIVRNPWDRLVSAFFFLKNGGYEEEDRKWAENNISKYSTFDVFVNEWLNEENIWLKNHFHPQYHYIFDEKPRNELDFIGRFERIDEDFAKICSKIGKPVQLNEENKSPRKDYRSYYTSETREKVGRIYGKDVELLGYAFDGFVEPS